MSDYIKVTKTDQVQPGQGKMVRVNQQEIALFNLEGVFYAIDNSCPHSTGPLAEGRLFGTAVTCPWHGAQFNVTDGTCLAGPASTNVTVYPVEVKDNHVFIKIP